MLRVSGKIAMRVQHRGVDPVRDVSPAGRRMLARRVRGILGFAGRWRLLVPMTVLAATGAWVSGALSGRAQEPTRIILIAVGAILTASAAALPLWQYRRANAERADAIEAAAEARIAMRVTLEDALDPIVHLVSRIGEAKRGDKARRRGEAIQLAVNTIAALMNADRVRVCFYRREPGPPAELSVDAFSGRAGAPNVKLLAGTAQGNAALRTVEAGQWLFVEDISREPAPFRLDDQPEYQAVLIGPVFRSGKPVGLLTLDALQHGELATADLPLLHLIAELLGIALSL
jgi:hypothetical protein